METIYEVITMDVNNDTTIIKGIYFSDGVYSWLTPTRSGECKNLKTALKKIGIENKVTVNK